MTVKRPPAALTALVALAVACSTGSGGGAAQPAGFDTRELIDVVAADRTPPIDRPKFVPTADATARLRDREPVIAVERRGRARAYPLPILLWHEVVNDSLAGRPILVNVEPRRQGRLGAARRQGPGAGRPRDGVPVRVGRVLPGRADLARLSRRDV